MLNKTKQGRGFNLCRNRYSIRNRTEPALWKSSIDTSFVLALLLVLMELPWLFLLSLAKMLSFSKFCPFFKLSTSFLFRSQVSAFFHSPVLLFLLDLFISTLRSHFSIACNYFPPKKTHKSC